MHDFWPAGDRRFFGGLGGLGGRGSGRPRRPRRPGFACKTMEAYDVRGVGLHVKLWCSKFCAPPQPGAEGQARSFVFGRGYM